MWGGEGGGGALHRASRAGFAQPIYEKMPVSVPPTLKQKHEKEEDKEKRQNPSLMTFGKLFWLRAVQG